jgi:hypothetical protein
MVHYPPAVETDETHNINMDKWSMSRKPKTNKSYAEIVKENASVWREAWRLNFGMDAVIRTNERWDNMVKHLGYAPHSVAWMVRDTLGQAITTDKDIIEASAERLREAEVIPENRLSARELAHLRLARAIVNEVTPQITGREVRAVYAAIIPPASDWVRTAGLYSRATKEIYIDLSQLERGSPTVDTVVHELAHHTSGAEDLEERHSAHMTMIAGYVVQFTHMGKFDELMKEVMW